MLKRDVWDAVRLADGIQADGLVSCTTACPTDPGLNIDEDFQQLIISESVLKLLSNLPKGE